MLRKSFPLLTAVLLFSCSQPQKTDIPESTGISYPETRKDSVSDDYFGVEVSDPYRWLEDDNSEETKKWVEAQNKVTFGYLAGLSQRDQIRKRLEKVWNFERYSTPFKKGPYYLFYKNDGIQNQSVLYIQNGIDGEPRVLLDPNKLSEDGTTALSSLGFSKDAKYLAYGTSHAGSDWKELFVMDIESGELLEDHIQWVKFSGISWQGNGFYYSRYDAPKEGSEYSQKNEFHKVYYHELGTPQSEDQLVFEDKEHPLRNFYTGTTEDERFTLLFSSESTSGESFAFHEEGKDEFTIVDPSFDYEYSVIGNVEDQLFVLTTHDAPNQRLIKIDTKNPSQESWVEIIPEKDFLLESAVLYNGKLAVKYLEDVKSQLYIHSLEGEMEKQIELPGPGIVGSFSAEKDDPVAFFSFVNYVSPTTIYQYNVETDTKEVFNQPEVDFDSDEFISTQVFYESKDGTEIPMYITHKKGLEKNGKNPVFLYGYGGFNISIKPRFSASMVAFLENGGIYAVPNLRGGGEYGEEWHLAGTKLEKQNVFDDFISAAEYLIKEGYTHSEKIAIHGRSNGGLLVGATMTQRPDLFKVAIPAVGVLDMLRYHNFTIGWAWATDYGSSDDEEQFKNLIKYSPLHNIRETAYPATMVMTADHDDRVVPAHSFKFISALQEKHNGEDPVLIRIDVDAGHGSGKPVSKQIDEYADMWAFVFHHLGMEIPAQKESAEASLTAF